MHSNCSNFFRFWIYILRFLHSSKSSGWNAQKWYPCVYFRNRGVPPLEKLDFQKGALFKKYIPLPRYPHSPNSPEINESHICTLPRKKTRNKNIENTKSYSSGNMHFLGRFFPRNVQDTRISATSFAGRLTFTCTYSWKMTIVQSYHCQLRAWW